MSKEIQIFSNKAIMNKIYVIRGKMVMINRDFAQL
jgi:hypothetical protein